MKTIIDFIGQTPLIPLQHIGNGRLYVKIEKNNPGASIKDRPAYAMIREAEESGKLHAGMKIVEPTSGNTGIALAWIGATLGYPVTLVMPASMSKERIKMMQFYGAQVELVEQGGMQGAVDHAKELVASGEYFMPDQFNNPANVQAHYAHTGPEILSALPALHGFVAGIGTGGTISGVGRYLKEQNKDVHIIGLEPEESPLLTKGSAGSHGIQGIGANFIPGILDQSVLDAVWTISSEDALKMSRRLAREEGLAVGISSGANVCGALRLLEQVEGPVVTVLPDTAERYASTALFESEGASL